MNEAPDPLEAELTSLRPHEGSPDLRRRLAEEFAVVPRTRRRWGFALAAASLAAVVIAWSIDRPVEPPIVVPPQFAPTAVAVVDGPTLLAYQHALARSPEALEALLDEHAKPLHFDVLPSPAFLPSEAIFQALLGDN